jgi:hypothetical protein
LIDKVPIYTPLREDLPHIPKPWSDIFYYTQYDALRQLSGGKKWTFSEVRPDGIIGFVPGTNAMNLAQGIPLCLCLWWEVHGRGAAVPFRARKRVGRAATETVFKRFWPRWRFSFRCTRRNVEMGDLLTSPMERR